MSDTMHAFDGASLLLHVVSLSLLTVGNPMSLAPECTLCTHRRTRRSGQGMGLWLAGCNLRSVCLANQGPLALVDCGVSDVRGFGWI